MRGPKIRILGAVAVSVAGVHLAVQPVAAQKSRSPITINQCSPILQNGSANSDQTFLGIPLGSLSSTSNGMRITFVNESTVIAKLVNFAVDSNGNRFVIRDVG